MESAGMRAVCRNLDDRCPRDLDDYRLDLGPWVVDRRRVGDPGVDRLLTGLVRWCGLTGWWMRR
jgi:hypothetical protein